MSSRTPARILEAPTLTSVMVSAQTGVPRVDRRHVKYTARGRTYLIPRIERQSATNVPYEDQVKSWHRRGKKARRHARQRAHQKPK